MLGLGILSVIACPVSASGVAGEGGASVTIEGLTDPRFATYVSPQENGDVRVESGTFNSGGQRTPRSGHLFRWSSGHGAFLVWTFRATVTHAGGTARFELSAADTEGRELRYAVGKGTSWTKPDAGLVLPSATGAVVDSGLTSGDSVVFQIAMPVHDTDPTGSFAPKIRYAAYVNGAPQSAVPATLAGLRRMQRLQPPQRLPLPVVPARARLP